MANRMSEKPYQASYGADNKHCVDGPGDGFGPYAGTLWPECRLADHDNAEAAARLCNEAYRQGYAKAQYDIRKALGSAS